MDKTFVDYKKETLVLYFVEDYCVLQLFYQGNWVDLFLQKDLIVIEIAGSSQDDMQEYDINKIPFIICKKIIVYLFKIKAKQTSPFKVKANLDKTMTLSIDW